jgi:hypothetical protein
MSADVALLFLCTRWLKGRQARSFVGFLLALNEAVRGKRLGDECMVSPAAEALLEVRQKRCAVHTNVLAAGTFGRSIHQYRPWLQLRAMVILP